MEVKETNIPNDCTYTVKYHIDPNKYKSIIDKLDSVQRGIVDTVLETAIHSELPIKEEMKKLYGNKRYEDQ